MYSINKCGTTLYGKRDVSASDGSYIATEWFIIFGLPIIPLRTYRVIKGETELGGGIGFGTTTNYVMKKDDFNWRQVIYTYLTGWGALVLIWLIWSYGFSWAANNYKSASPRVSTPNYNSSGYNAPANNTTPSANTDTAVDIAGSTEKKNFYASTDYFGINFPVSPIHNLLKALPTDHSGTTYDLSTYESKSNDKLFSVHRYTFSRQMIFPGQEKQILDGFGQNMMNARPGNKLISSRFVSFLSYSGLKLNYQSEDQYIWAILLTANKDLYLIMAQYPSTAGNYNEKEFVDFAGSFVITR